MLKKAIILLATGFEEIEAVTVIDILRRAGIELTIAGLDGINITGSHGITITANKKLGGLLPDFDAVIIPGGMPGALHLHNSSEVNDFIKKMHSIGAIIAGICAAPSVIMAPIGILYDKTATCYPGDQIDFGKNTRYENKAVVIDGNIITSQGPATAMEFAFAIVEKLIGEDTVKKLRKHTLAD
ncbi:MAG: DJ-1/PfpI family protein [Candidatus Omnitrophica bacterium]|nr:DJ-1/PfpI family protein [Candidatus Omnitrophota bacterium]